MALPRSAAVALLAALTACAGARPPWRDPDLPARLSARAAAMVGETGPFDVGGRRLNADCSGFVEAVYEAEGVPLRRLVAAAAPGERSGVLGLLRAVERYGTTFGGGGAWPAPGDLVFWHATYDRNRDGARTDRFTHVGIVESVDRGTITFVHRGGRAVARGTMTPGRPLDASDGRRVLNTPLRASARGSPRDAALAGALFGGYGRLDPERAAAAAGAPR